MELFNFNLLKCLSFSNFCATKTSGNKLFCMNEGGITQEIYKVYKYVSTSFQTLVQIKFSIFTLT